MLSDARVVRASADFVCIRARTCTTRVVPIPPDSDEAWCLGVVALFRPDGTVRAHFREPTVEGLLSEMEAAVAGKPGASTILTGTVALKRLVPAARTSRIRCPKCAKLDPDGKRPKDLVSDRFERVRWAFVYVREGLEGDPFPLRNEFHPWMGGWIDALDHPIFAATGPDGKYRIAGLPPGDYTVAVWQERCAPVSRKIEVKEGDIRTVNFLLEAKPE